MLMLMHVGLSVLHTSHVSIELVSRYIHTHICLYIDVNACEMRYTVIVCTPLGLRDLGGLLWPYIYTETSIMLYK